MLRYTERVFQCGREITNRELDEIQETVGMFPMLSCNELAATICEHLGWMTASGSYKTEACLKLLEKLESGGFVRLPEKRKHYIRRQSQKPISLTSRTRPKPDIICDVKELGLIRIKAIKDKDSTGL